MMRVALIAVLVVVGLIVVVALVGMLLPVGHRATREATYRVDAAQLFALLTSPADFPAWRSDVTSVELLPASGGRPQFRERSRHGAILFSVVRTVPNQEVVTEIADRGLPYGGSWTFRLLQTGDSTALRITEDGKVYNPVFRFVSRFIIGHNAGIDRYLRDVGRRFEQTVEPRPATP
jgi:uncharacterized protein YndB with AHSA1/START domain